MQTLLEFLNPVKQMEYLIAIGFLVAFIIFWRLLTRAHRAPGKESADKEGKQ